ncbi:MAG TPA: hypothetical protein VGD21_12145 [Lysobacter sp.]
MRNLVAAALLILISASDGAYSREPIAGLPCEGCEAVFEGLPKNLAPTSRIASRGEPGQPMTVTGRVYGPDRKPRAGVIIYAYQTNTRGIYPAPPKPLGRASDRHGQLRGWVLTDANGRYTFETIRPASYPTRDVPAHIHMHVIERQCATYYIDDIMFTDDPLLTPEERQRHRAGRAGNGIATPTRKDGRWRVTRDIQLGSNIPGYPKCGGRRAAT